MEYVGIKELSQKTSKYIDSDDWIVVTKNGKPIKLLMAIDSDDLEDLILARHFDLDTLAPRAQREKATGKTTSLRAYLNKRL